MKYFQRLIIVIFIAAFFYSFVSMLKDKTNYEYPENLEYQDICKKDYVLKYLKMPSSIISIDKVFYDYNINKCTIQ